MNDPPPPAGTAVAAQLKAAYCHGARTDAIRIPFASALPLLYSTSNRLITSSQLSNSAAGADQSLMEIMFTACCRSR